MAPNPRRVDERLEALYAQIPDIECRGLCYDSCGPVGASVREDARAGGLDICDDGYCNKLTADGRCSVYEDRPMICRLYGVARGLKCPYGCVPERYLSRVEAGELLAQADIIGGVPRGRADELTRGIERTRRALTVEALERKLAKVEGHPITLHGRNPRRTVIDR